MIDIIIPVYNCEKHLNQCLDSLYQQIYKDFNIIAIDDGSTDKSLEILKKYEEKHANFVIITQKNQGPSVARNAGLDYIQKRGGGEFVIFVDADDWVEPTYLSCLIELMDENVGMASCGYKWQKRTKRHFKNKRAKILNFDKTDGFCQLFVDRYLFTTLWNKLLRYENIKDLRFNSSLFYAEDIYFMVEYVANLPKNCILRHTTKKLYHYTITKGGLSFFGFDQNKLRILDSIPYLRETALKVDEKTLKYINSWEFLVLVEFIIYFRGKDKNKHKIFKTRAKELLKDYKTIKHEYFPLRKLANLIFGLL